ncbi:MAG TPA: GSU2403 family nucleotidyltransferase fold protein [Allosphingosinicella sp.]|nr:GSU2403 family nucleotidyltransferase fold protein [Allosphingosinicella sp.]
MEIRYHSPTAQAAYHDLLSLLLDEAVSEIRGSPTLKEREGKGYWYDHYRIGTEVKDRYLGEDTATLRARIDRHLELKKEAQGRRRERSRLVRLLRSERFLGMDAATGSLVSALAKTGVFRLGGTLVGTNAFRLYEGELGMRLSLDQTAMTSDIDIASFEKLSLALEDAVEPDLTGVFNELNFAPVPALDQARTWRWRQSDGATYVEFLTPSFSEEEGLRDLAALGVSAQALHHLNYLIAEPIDAAGIYRDGILIRAPRPERFAIHKLIVADRRRDGRDSLKSRKDMMQAEMLITLLARDRPGDLADAYHDAMQRGPRWRERLERSLAHSDRAQEAIAALA